LINEAVHAGARSRSACAELCLSLRTYHRWQDGGGIKTDGRPHAVRPVPAHKLSDEERERILQTCHQPEYASLPPSQIVPALADQGVYLASESSFYRVLRDADEQHHRGRSQSPQVRRPLTTHCATRSDEVWSWDITYLAGPVRGAFFYLYLIVDIFSRKIVGWEVHEKECAQHAAMLVRCAVLSEGIPHAPRVLHADNGSPMKGATLRATLQQLGIEPSYIRSCAVSIATKRMRKPGRALPMPRA
jgi:putative transposase